MNIEKSMVIPIFIPHNGCPNDCIFCNQKKISGHLTTPNINDVDSTIQEYLKSNTRNSKIEVGFFGGSFTGVDEKIQKELLGIAKKYLDDGKIQNIRISTRPDYINDNILNYLKEYGVGTIELGVQSLDDEVLKKSNRGHDSKQVYIATDLIKKWKFELGIQTMIGLPGDTEIKALETAEKVVNINPSIVRIYPSLVVKDTELEFLFKNGEYSPLTLEEAIMICKKLLMVYYQNGINVIRVGLQPTENINVGQDIIAGPFHPAFRQLVDSELALDHLEKQIINKKLQDSELLNIKANEKLHSIISGHNKKNIKYLQKKYNIKKIKLTKSFGAYTSFYLDDIIVDNLFRNIWWR
jgi:histone acetyltransferase (RNA polymerase elongator complex component)